MTHSEPTSDGRWALWCGGVLTAVFLFSPPLAWLGSRGYSTVLAFAGLFTLPAWRLQDRDRPAAAAILVLLAWAVISTFWSPYHPRKIGENTALKLVLQAGLYTAAICAARVAAPTTRTWMLRALAWGTALLGLVLLIEGITGAAIYQALRAAAHDPIRPDLGVRNAARGLFVLALFTPAATLASMRVGGRRIAVPFILAGLIWPSHAFSYDAPLLSLALAAVAGWAVWTWPRRAPQVFAAASGLFFLGAPLIVWTLERLGAYDLIQSKVSLSWSQRMGYWRHAVAWIGDHPFRGWGLDSSRMFGPGIKLHPHDAALQIWLELGAIGALAAAALWVAIFLGLGRDRRDPAMAAAAATGVVYLTFDAVSFGVWQEWWLALGALACVACVALARHETSP